MELEMMIWLNILLALLHATAKFLATLLVAHFLACGVITTCGIAVARTEGSIRAARLHAANPSSSATATTCQEQRRKQKHRQYKHII